MEEVWKPIEGYDGLYEVSNLGRVRSLDRVVQRPYKGHPHWHMTLKGRVVELTVAGIHLSYFKTKASDAG